MVLIYLYHFLFGYVVFSAQKGKTERFINLCTKNKISLWSMRKRGDVLYGRMHIKDYKKIYKTANKAKVILKIQSRHGLPHVIDGHSDRIGLPIGIAIFFAVNIFLGWHIWDISITGNEEVLSSQLMQEMENLNFSVGENYKNTDIDGLEQDLLLQFPGCSYINIEMEGCYATVDIRERVEKEQDPNEGYPTNIVAASDGYIINVETYSGNAEVKEGQAVSKGQIIISGTYQMKDGRTDFVNAGGKAIAETHHTITQEVMYEQTETIIGEEIDTKRVLNVFGINIPLYLSGVAQPYSKELYRWQPNINNKNLPIVLTTAKFYETTEVTKTLTKEQALEKCRAQTTAEINDQLANSEIISSKESIQYLDDRVIITQDITCHEDIAIEQRISIEEIND